MKAPIVFSRPLIRPRLPVNKITKNKKILIPLEQLETVALINRWSVPMRPLLERYELEWARHVLVPAVASPSHLVILSLLLLRMTWIQSELTQSTNNGLKREREKFSLPQFVKRGNETERASSGYAIKYRSFSKKENALDCCCASIHGRLWGMFNSMLAAATLNAVAEARKRHLRGDVLWTAQQATTLLAPPFFYLTWQEMNFLFFKCSIRCVFSSSLEN